jgi:2-polyprenyl-3-methyl-5-hydroxy-6-metoxy-1,4-benzoquinol methylase
LIVVSVWELPLPIGTAPLRDIGLSILPSVPKVFCDLRLPEPWLSLISLDRQSGKEMIIMNASEIHEAMAKYKFYHVIRLTDEISTPGYPANLPVQNLCMKHLRSLDLRDKRVLDIGCRDGLFSFAAESMGAAEVIAIDNDLSRAGVEFLIPFFNSKVKMHQMNLYDLQSSSFGSFDVVIFPGVLYHLRYPFWGLKKIREVMKISGHLVIETAIWEAEHNNSILFCPIGKDSPYEESSCCFFNEKGLVDTLKSMGFETVSVDYLLKYQDLPQTKRLNRGVFHSIYHGCDKNSFLMRYWEGMHDLHSRHLA